MLVTNFLEIEGVKLINSISSEDLRGRFVKFLPTNLLNQELDSVAVSFNPQVGTIRGLHFQVEPYAEEKIISCIQGATFEVIVDIRLNSRSFGKFASFQLTQESNEQVYLPKGVAHGFQTLLPNSIVHYILTSQYSQPSSFSINPFSLIGVNWPIGDFTISEKDQKGISVEVAAQRYADSIVV